MFELIVQLIAIMMILLGMVFQLVGMWYRKPDHPEIEGKVLSPVIPRKKMRRYYEGSGYKYHVWGYFIGFGGLTLNMVYWLFVK